MASNARRSESRGRPPLACEGVGGINGRPRSHNSSVTSHGRALGIDSACSFSLPNADRNLIVLPEQLIDIFFPALLKEAGNRDF